MFVRVRTAGLQEITHQSVIMTTDKRYFRGADSIFDVSCVVLIADYGVIGDERAMRVGKAIYRTKLSDGSSSATPSG